MEKVECITSVILAAALEHTLLSGIEVKLQTMNCTNNAFNFAYFSSFLLIKSTTSLLKSSVGLGVISFQ